MTTHFLGLNQWELLGTFNRERIGKAADLGRNYLILDTLNLRGQQDIQGPMSSSQLELRVKSEKWNWKFWEVISLEVIREVMDMNVASEAERTGREGKKDMARTETQKTSARERAGEGR